MEDVAANELTNSVAYLRDLFKRREVALPSGSVLEYYLDETQKFVDATMLRTPPATIRDQEQEEIDLGAVYLSVFRLAETCQVLESRSVPKLTERLRDDLAPKQISHVPQVEQFFDYEYELFCAREFTFGGHRVSLITDNLKRPSRYQKRVEFLIDNKWPVECKRPRNSVNAVSLLRDAAEKIVERAKPGVVCLLLDLALKPTKPFQEFMNEHELGAHAQQILQAFRDEHVTKLVAVLQPTPARC